VISHHCHRYGLKAYKANIRGDLIFSTSTKLSSKNPKPWLDGWWHLTNINLLNRIWLGVKYKFSPISFSIHAFCSFNFYFMQLNYTIFRILCDLFPKFYLMKSKFFLYWLMQSKCFVYPPHDQIRISFLLLFPLVFCSLVLN